ncbi:uncharacterized protein LOC130445771 [Diorhabda sublineata]|uniref:uncharacterized protein LOC130445771 n=1 Tax=Diorhabda sublineata TaxID=1163346 RepID=UPI0024E0C4A9|nr:uncharacterized protein LOC130445771 [Diorhabda sublineata]
MANTNNFNMDDFQHSKQFQDIVHTAVQKAVADYFEGKPWEKQHKHKHCRWSRWNEKSHQQQQSQSDMANGPDFKTHGPPPFWFHRMNHRFGDHPNHFDYHHHHYGPWCWNQCSYYRKPDNFRKFCEPGHLFDFTE